VSGAALSEVRERCFSQDDDAEQIRFNLRTEFFKARVFERSDVAVSSIVHQNVQSTKSPDRPFNRVIRLGFVCHIEGERQNAIAIFWLKIGKVTYCPGSGRDAVPGFKPCDCKRAS
jgi:hypothetical protein